MSPTRRSTWNHNRLSRGDGLREKMRPVEEQLRLLMRGVVYGDEGVQRAMESELRERLAEGRPLRVYLGIDPTAPDLTLGHTVPMRKLRQFQDLGHETILLIGGFTALVGDPSDKDSARPMLTLEQIEENARTYAEQAFRVLDRDRTIIRNNAEWLSKLDFQELIKIASNFTVGQFLQRDNFALRRERGDPIYVHEFFYAFMQAYDAVALETDVQLGATEQLFNLMAGRDLQRAYGQRPQIAITMPILVGTDGHRMSKSQNNYIALNDPPTEMYGKVMKLPDPVMIEYFTLVTNVSGEEIEEMRRQLTSRSVNPMEIKKHLAREIVGEFYGAEAAQEAEREFDVRHGQHRRDQVISVPVPTVGVRALAPTVSVSQTAPIEQVERLGLLKTLLVAAIVPSKSEGRRLLKQGAIDVDGQPIASFEVELKVGSTVRVGKHRFLRIVDADKQE
jgi:tyrosyl-tRNA synthetase